MDNNIIYLDRATAATMTMLSEILKVYKTKNVGGKYDDAMEKDKAVYDTLMDQVLGRDRNEDSDKQSVEEAA